MGNCPDAALVEEVAAAIRVMVQPGASTRPALLNAMEEHGGPILFVGLLQREQQPLRLLALRILTAFVPGMYAEAAVARREGGGCFV